MKKGVWIVTKGSFWNQELENTSLNQCCQVLDFKKNICFSILFIYVFIDKNLPYKFENGFFLIYKSPKLSQKNLEIGLV
jgi:hypothetical protein